MGSDTEGSTANPRRRRDVRIVRRSSDEAVPTYREARQLELYVHRLRLLERDLAAHRMANRSEAARETRETLRAERARIRRLCDDAGLDPPPELPPDD